MHPELRRIEEQYLALVADLQAGHVSQADAMVVLANLTAVDGEGWVWSIDPYTGDFLRALPGQPGSPADPSAFVVSRLPVVPVEVPPHGTPMAQVSEFLHPNLRPLPPAPASERAMGALSGVAGGVANGLGAAARPLAGVLRGRGRTVVVVLVAVLLVGALFTQRPGSDAPESTSPESVATPTVPPPTIVIPGAETASTVPADGASTVPPSTLAPVPTDAELAALLGLLGTGDAAALAAVLPESERERLDLLPVLGAVRAGFPLSFAAPKVSGTDATVVVRAGDPEAPVRRWSLRLRRSPAGSWVIVSAARG